MANLQKRSGRSTHTARVDRGFRLAVTGGTAGVIAVISLLSALILGTSGLIPVIAIIIAVVCLMMFRGLSSR